MRRTVLVAGIAGMGLVAWSAAVVSLVAAWRLVGQLDNAAEMAHLAPHPQATVVFDREGRPAFSFFVEQRMDIPLDRVSPNMVHALLAVEDRRFYSHHGLDFIRIGKAAWRNWRAGRIVEGGSTITQQLARVEQLSPSRTFARKIREAMIAARLEERYSKDEILQAYFNTVYFGDGFHGVEAAARGYFGKAASDLQPAEAALLAAVVRSPSGYYSPSASPARALARRNLVLRLMRESGWTTDAAYRTAVEAPLPRAAMSHGIPLASVAAAGGATTGCGLYFQEELRRELVSRFGGKQVLRGGLRVYTSYDPRMQCEAERAISSRIAAIVKTHRAAADLQGSLVAIDPSTGAVRALVGGRDFAASSFNRAVQARRQPGSAFKPIVYAAALERGFAPGSMLHNLDAPIQTANGPWLPGGEHEQSDYTLRTALRISSNRAAAQLLQLVGITTATYYAQRLGIASPLPSVPSLALGTGGVTLVELTSAYGVFANQGMAIAPHLIDRVEDHDGQILWANVPAQSQAVSPTTAFLMSSMLSDVITSGTATTARAAGFTLPAAGKTGTTDGYTDAWFVGYTPHLVAGVWFGMDRPSPIMNRGFAAVVAVPAWAAFMKQATAGDRPDWFPMPADVEKVAICRLSGARATDACRHPWLDPGYVQAGLTTLPGQITAAGAMGTTGVTGSNGVAGTTGRIARALEPGVYEDYFPIGTAPTEPCPLHGLSPADGVPGVDGYSAVAANVESSAPHLQNASIRPAPVLAPAAEKRLVVDRITRPDGTIRFVIHR